MITLEEISQAHKRIEGGIVKTPSVYSPFLSEMFEADIYLKLENQQFTGSFKERGALNFLLSDKGGCKSQVVAASAGNHAQAVAWHAKNHGFAATIFMPLATSNVKILQTEKFGAKVVLTGNSYDEAYDAAIDYCNRHNARYVHAYNDRAVIAGQGTIGLELYEQLGHLDAVLVPVGGGGLIAGVGSSIIQLCKKTQVIGVEAVSHQSLAQALLKGGPFRLAKKPSIAEGIAVSLVGQINYEICRRINPILIGVDDQMIQRTIMLLMERQRIVTEGAGAAACAALLTERVQKFIKNKKIAIIVSGGNIDLSLLSRLAAEELIHSRRWTKISLTISDRPGSLQKFLNTVSGVSANIIEIHHERHFAPLRWNEVLINVIVETKDQKHEDQLINLLKQEGYAIKRHKGDTDLACIKR